MGYSVNIVIPQKGDFYNLLIKRGFKPLLSNINTYRGKNIFDVLFLNQDNEITEGAITNLVIKKDKNYWTPSLASGLLPGVYREYLLDVNKIPLKEKVLYKEDLINADKIFVANSVRKMLPAKLI